MDQYRINDLERLSGVKAHTIRIWEKRYGLITPSRTATNRRYYNGDQLRRLMNVAMLLSQGYKISNLAELTDSQLTHHIEQLHNAPGADIVCAALIHDLTTAMLGFEEAGFDKAFQSALDQFGFSESMLRVFYPFLKKTGLLWRVDKAQPAEEHFAACIIRNKIIALTAQLPLTDQTKDKFMLFLPPGEWHEIGLLFANYLIRAAGSPTIYLGQNVPYQDISKIANSIQPNFLLTFYITPKPKDELNKEIASLTASAPVAQVLISGDVEQLHGIGDEANNVTILYDVESLLKFL